MVLVLNANQMVQVLIQMVQVLNTNQNLKRGISPTVMRRTPDRETAKELLQPEEFIQKQDFKESPTAPLCCRK